MIVTKLEIQSSKCFTCSLSIWRIGPEQNILNSLRAPLIIILSMSCIDKDGIACMFCTYQPGFPMPKFPYSRVEPCSVCNSNPVKLILRCFQNKLRWKLWERLVYIFHMLSFNKAEATCPILHCKNAQLKWIPKFKIFVMVREKRVCLGVGCVLPFVMSPHTLLTRDIRRHWKRILRNGIIYTVPSWRLQLFLHIWSIKCIFPWMIMRSLLSTQKARKI